MEQSEFMESSIQASFQDEKTIRQKELFLDTKGVCFICFKGDFQLNENNSHRHGMTEVCLRNICRYLNINPSSILLESLKESLFQDEQESCEKCDFSVLLCLTCSSIANKLSKMIREVEIAKMLLHNQLQIFHQVLEASRKEPERDGRWWKLQEELTSGNRDSPGVETCLLDKLRQETSDKCSSKVKRLLSTSLPKVQITQMKNKIKKEVDLKEVDLKAVGDIVHKAMTLENEEIPMPLTPCHTDQSSVTIPSQRLPISTVPTVDLEEDPLEVEVIDNTGSFSQTSIDCSKTGPILTAHFEKVAGNIYSCTICKNLLQLPEKRDILEHFANIHPETFFAEKKLPFVEEETFKLFCGQVLNASTKIVKGRKGTMQHRIELFCTICNFKSTNNPALRYHLVQEHYKILQENIVLRQLRSAPIPPLPENSVRRASHVFHNKPVNPALEKHSKTYSTRKSSTMVSNIPCSIIEIINIEEECDAAFTGLTTTTAQNTSTSNRSSFSPDTNLNSPKGSKWIEMDSRPSSSGYSTSNINISTKDDLNSESPKPKQRKWKPTGNLMVNSFAKKMGQHWGGRYECRVCGQFLNESVYINHMVNSHPDKVFASAKFPNIPETTFKKFCRDVLKSETIEAAQRRINSNCITLSAQQQKFLCIYCNHECNAYNDLSYHLALDHFSILEEKLVRYQADNFSVQSKSKDIQKNRQTARKRTSGSLWRNERQESMHLPSPSRPSMGDTFQTRSGRVVKNKSYTEAFPRGPDFQDGEVAIIFTRDGEEDTTEEFTGPGVTGGIPCDEKNAQQSSMQSQSSLLLSTCQTNPAERDSLPSGAIKKEIDDRTDMNVTTTAPEPSEEPVEDDNLFESKYETYFKVEKTEPDLSSF